MHETPDAARSKNLQSVLAPPPAGVEELLDLVKSNLRTREDNDVVYVDLDGNLATIARSQHQVVFGRRGSGKSSLLLAQYALSLSDDSQMSVYLSAELLKRTSYADVLCRIVLEVLRRLPRRRASKLLPLLITELEEMLAQEDDLPISQETSHDRGSDISAQVGGQAGHAKARSAAKQSTTTSSHFIRNKATALERRLPDYSAELAKSLKADKIGRAFLMLDDFYLLERDSQPDVADYIHRMLGGTGMYFKIGTVRYRSQLRRGDTRMIGIDVGQDFEAVDLDLTLEDVVKASAFLQEILDTMAAQCGMENFTSRVVDEAAFTMLVVAAGGVARDFLALFADACRSWLSTDEAGPRMLVGHVVTAVGDYWTSTKISILRDELVSASATISETVFTDIRRFSLQEARTPIFGLLRTDLIGVRDISRAIEELIDLKLIHMLRRSNPIAQRDDEATTLLLDLSAYNFLDEYQSTKGLSALIAGHELPHLELSNLYMLAEAQAVIATLVEPDEASELKNADTSSNLVSPTASQPASAAAVERPLPKSRMSRTTSFRVGGAEGYITAGVYDDGDIAEIHIGLGKQGSTLAGIIEALNLITSMALQHGVPLEKIVGKMTNLSFEPAGLTDDPDVRMAKSITDYLFRRLALDYLSFETREKLGIYSAEERQAYLETGSYTRDE